MASCAILKARRTWWRAGNGPTTCSPHVVACRQWADDLLAAGRRILVPEIAGYEVRRELVRRNSQIALGHLDRLAVNLGYLALTTDVMKLAATLWTQARNTGVQTAPNPALDADVILAAQALSLNVPVVVATENAAHLSRFVPAELWANIKP